MTGREMGFARRSGAAAMLRAGGSVQAVLKMAASAVAGAVGEELGVAAPLFADVPLRDVVVRRDAKTGAVTELMIGAAMLEETLSLTDAESVLTTLSGAAGIVLGRAWMRVLRTQVSSFGGVTLLYRVGVEATTQVEA